MKKGILLLTICFISIASFAQPAATQARQQSKHEVSIWGAYGLSTLKYDLSFGERDKLGLGYMGGIGYNYFLNYNWSVGVGAEYSALSSTADFTKLLDHYAVPGIPSTDVNGNTSYGKPWYLKINATDYEQTYNAFYINVPVMAKYQMDVWKQHKFYAAAGVKLGIPVKGKYTTKGSYVVDGYEQLGGNPSALNGIPGLGFGSRTMDDKNREFDLDINYMLALEAGMKWKLNNKLALYTGVFADLGLADIRKGDENLDFIQFNHKGAPLYEFAGYTPNNALHSQYAPEVYNQRNSFTDRVSTLSAGLKVQLAFGFGAFNNKKAKKSTAIVASKDKPFEGVTASQLEDILGRNTQMMIEFQQKEFDELKKMVEREDPELTYAIINFDLDKKQILPRMYVELDKKVDLMNKYPNAKIMLEGHTDDLGSDEYNYQLGLDRANAAKNYLVSKGINASRLSVSSKGRTAPAVPNSNEQNRFKNRRVEFILMK